MPSSGYIATRTYTDKSGVTVFIGPAVDYINPATDLSVELIANGVAKNAGVIFERVADSPSTNQFSIDGDATPPTVTLGVALAHANDVLRVRRETARGSREVDFVQGSTLTEADLDKATKQGIYLAEEALDRTEEANNLYDDMSGTYTAGVMPDYGPDGNILISDSSDWAVVAADSATARTYLGLGSAAEGVIGTGIGQVPVNTTAAVLGSAAYVAHGTADGEVPLNSDLGTVRTLDTGVAVNNVIKLAADGEIPTGVKGTNLGNLHRPPHITIRHAYLSTGSLSTSGSSYALSGTTQADRWYARPMNEILVRPINGALEDLGIELTLPDNEEGALADGGVGSEINFTEEGTYEVEILSQFYRANAFSSRLVDLDDSTVSEQVLIQGTTCHSQNTDATGVSTGTGIIVIGSGGGSGIGKERALLSAVPVGDPLSNQVDADCRRFQLQFVCTENFSADNVLGPSMVDEIANTAGASAIFMTNVFATIDIKKIA